MTAIASPDYQQLGNSRGAADHDHDLVHELSRRLDGLWRYDQYVANAANEGDLLKFWETIKAQDRENIAQLKQLIRKHIQNNCF